MQYPSSIKDQKFVREKVPSDNFIAVLAPNYLQDLLKTITTEVR